MFTFIVNGYFINAGIGEDNMRRKRVDPLNFASRYKQSVPIKMIKHLSIKEIKEGYVIRL